MDVPLPSDKDAAAGQSWQRHREAARSGNPAASPAVAVPIFVHAFVHIVSLSDNDNDNYKATLSSTESLLSSAPALPPATAGKSQLLLPCTLLFLATLQCIVSSTIALALLPICSLPNLLAFQVFLLALSETMAPSGNQPGARRPAANPPVHRRGAYQYRPPLAAPTVPTDETVRDQRRAAFRNQVRYPHALADATINRHLNQHDWDVNRAVQSFWESEEAGRAAGANRPATVELGRVHALHSLQTSLGNNRNEALRTNNAVMALLYHKMGWNFDQAIKEVTTRKGHYDDFVDELGPLRLPVDGDATRDERLARFIDITSTNSWYSAQQFLEACGWDIAKAIDAWFRSGGLPIVYPPKPRGKKAVRDSGLRDVDVNRPFRAVQGTLQQFDLEQGAFNDQMTANTITFNRPRSEVNDDPEIPWSRVDELPARLRNMARTTARLDPEQIPRQGYLPSMGKNRGGRGFPTAALINRDRSAPALHCPDPTKLYVEYIRKGKYHCQWIEGNRGGVRFGWDEGANPLGEGFTEFDWHDLSHIQRLTKWRNNLLLELTGEVVREPVGDKLNKYENDWLREQEAIRLEERYEQMVEAFKKSGEFDYDALFDFFYNGSNFPLPMSKDEGVKLTRRFNETFAGQSFFEKKVFRCPPLAPGEDGAFRCPRRPLGDGRMEYVQETVTKDMSLVGDVPRPTRTEGVILMQRFRHLATAKHFGYGKKNAAKANKIDGTPDDPDSDFEDQAVNDDEDDVPPSRFPSPPGGAPGGSNANLLGGYAPHVLDYANGVLPFHVFQEVVVAESRSIDAANMTSMDWGRVLGVMTEYYRTQQGRDEQRAAARFLYDVNLSHLDLNFLTSAEVLHAISQRRDGAAAEERVEAVEEQEQVRDLEDDGELELLEDFEEDDGEIE